MINYIKCMREKAKLRNWGFLFLPFEIVSNYVALTVLELVYIYLLCIYVSVCVEVRGYPKRILFFLHGSSWAWTQVIRLGSKCLPYKVIVPIWSRSLVHVEPYTETSMFTSQYFSFFEACTQTHATPVYQVEHLCYLHLITFLHFCRRIGGEAPAQKKKKDMETYY